MRFLLVLALIFAPFTAAETIVVEPECGEQAPQGVWDLPLCSDFEYDGVLLAAIEEGDRSAVQMALRRYHEALTWAQKLRLAPVLLHDAAVWDELFQLARHALDDAIEGQHWYLALDTYEVVSVDPRSRALMRKGLENEAPKVVSIAISGLARQGDVSAIPLIDRALVRMADDAYWVSLGLQWYDTDAAKRVAAKYQRDYAE